MFKRFFFWLILAIAVIGALSAIRLVILSRKVATAAAPLNEPPRTPFANTIGGRGLVESLDENVRVAPALAGLVAKVHVEVGHEVKNGDVLLELDQRESAAMVAAQEAEIAALRTEVKEVEVNLADKRDQWTRMEKLLASKVASEDEKQRLLFAAQAMESRLESTKAKVESASAQLLRFKVQLDLLTVRAPRDGQILQVNIRAGEYAQPSAQEPTILLGQVDELQLRVDIDEDSASRVVAGMSAKAYVKGRREVEIPLTFVRVEPYIRPKKSLTGESSERVDTRVLQLIYRFKRPPALSVYVGQQMDVFLDASSGTAKQN